MRRDSSWVRFTSLAPIVVATLQACGGQPEATRASFGQPIAVGPYVLEVTGAEPGPEPPPPVNVFRTREDEKNLVVYVYWRDLAGLEPAERRVFAQKFLESRLTVVDQRGDRRQPVTAEPKDLLMSMSVSDDWRNWAVVFHVFRDATSPTLVVENPDPQPGQPRAVSVDLGLWREGS